MSLCIASSITAFNTIMAREGWVVFRGGGMRVFYAVALVFLAIGSTRSTSCLFCRGTGCLPCRGTGSRD